MLPQYTFALGGTEAIKKVFDFFEDQKKAKEFILKKMAQEKDYNIGSDATYESERETVIKKRGEA